MDIRMLRVLQMLAAAGEAPLEQGSKQEPGSEPESKPEPKPEPEPLLTARELEELRRAQMDRMREEYAKAKEKEAAAATARSKAELERLMVTNPDHPRVRAEIRRQRRATRRLEEERG